MYDVLILGAGAAGLMCAYTAGQRGFTCAVLDHGPVAGRKVRIAGGGKGNVTNRFVSTDCYVGENPHFAAKILRGCPPDLVLAMLDSFGIPWEERDHGQLFCTVQAVRLVENLTARITSSGSKILAATKIDDVTCAGGMFTAHTSQGAISAPRLVIATGSPAWPAAGATDWGMRLARRFGHKVIPVRPVLCPFVLPDSWPLHGLSGLSLPARLSTESMPKQRSDVLNGMLTDALLFTHKGLSGPAALQASCFWRPGQTLNINFLPEKQIIEIMHQPDNGKLTPSGLLKRLLPSRLAALLMDLLPKVTAERQIAQLGKAERLSIAALIHDHQVVPGRTEGMGRAEAAAGGVDTGDINPKSLESRLVKGLYLAGEVLDVTGLLGGYNLHWAWASGKAAAEAFRH